MLFPRRSAPPCSRRGPSTITVALAPGSPSTVLSGGLTARMADDGEVTFPDLVVRTPGCGVPLLRGNAVYASRLPACLLWLLFSP